MMSPSDLLTTQVLTILSSLRHTKLPQVQTEFSVAKTKVKEMEKCIDFPFHSTHSKLHRILHATKVDVKSLVVHFTIQSINYTFRCQNDKEMKNIWFTGFVISSESCIRCATKGEGDGKHIFVGFHHLQ